MKTTSPMVDLGQTKVVVLPNIRVPHGCSTRVGGKSEGHLASFNTGFTVGDEPSNVWHNRGLFAQLLKAENLPWLLSMTHGTEVVVVNEAPPVPTDLSVRPGTFYSADGCVTNVPGVPLSLTVADCVPVFFHDPVQKAVGVSHAGWRGTVGGIVKRTVEVMGEHFDSQPNDIQVGIGPSIGPKSFEVGGEVVEEFRAAFPENPEIILPHPNPGSGKAYIDLWAANKLMARRAGVPEKNIEISGWCTVSHPELFFSHRRDKGKSGRLLAGIVLPPA